MSILIKPTIDPKVVAASELRAAVSEFAVSNLRGLVAGYNQGLALVWSNSKLSPAEAIAALGTDALEVFRAHGAMKDCIQSILAASGDPTLAALPEFALNKPTFAFSPELDADGHPTGRILVSDQPYEG